MRLSVIIVNYNVKHFLEQCLHSVMKAAERASFEVIVVDNNSIDGSQEMVEQRFPSVRLIENLENVGFSRANNQAISQSTGEFVLLLNPDTVVEEDTFEKVLSFMDSQPDAGGLGVKMIDGKGNFLPESKRGLPTPSVAFYKMFGLSKLFPQSKKFGKYHLSYLEENSIHQVDVLSGAFMLLRKEVLDEVGLLDEDFFMYGEDIDLSYRIIQGGYKNYYYPETSIIHYKGESTKKSSINYVFVFYRAMVIFARKHFNEKRANTFSLLINIAIWLRASFDILIRFVQRALLPATDLTVIVLGLFLIKDQYQEYSGVLYDPQLLKYAFPIYGLIWLACIFLAGGYDQRVKLLRVVTGILVGTGIILVAYSLLSEEYRFSRALILLGTAWTIISITLIRVVLHLSGLKAFRLTERIKSRFAIVGEQDEVARVSKLLKESNLRTDFIAPVHPTNQLQAGFASTVDQLQDVVDIFKIDEVIFCARSFPANKIIRQMSLLRRPEISFKIAPPESLFIIGSNSINSSGELYSMMDINAISKPANMRYKRTLDLLFALLFLSLLPILLVVVKHPLRFTANLFSVLIGQKSWVGFATEHAKLTFSKVKKGVLTPIGALAPEQAPPEAAEKMDLLYAKDYRVSNDVGIVLKGIRHLGKS